MCIVAKAPRSIARRFVAVMKEAEMKETDNKKEEKKRKLAYQVLGLSKDEILVNLRFLDNALAMLRLEERAGQKGMSCDGAKIYFDSGFVLRRYKREPNYIARIYLHILFHCIFSHGYACEKLNRQYWDLATDIAVENIIIEMNLHSTRLKKDAVAESKLRVLKEEIGNLTAEKIYKYFKKQPPTPGQIEDYQQYFKKDEHSLWFLQEQEEIVISNEQWKKISERIKADLKSFSKDKNMSESLEKNLAEATKETYDYKSILERFMVMGEDIQVNDDEFDYIYYTYGLSTYKNMPLVEPLEYKDVNKIREFAIVIDTSASCRGNIVKAFLNKTYNILTSQENFFRKTNIHIIQCDNEVQSDTKITCQEDFLHFMEHGKLKGFGATDFRPAFTYIQQLQTQREFSNLKGVIYFTDGYGVYPQKTIGIDTIFAFLNEDETRPALPPWAMKVILDEETLEEEE